MRIECRDCGFIGNAKTIIADRPDLSYGEMLVCPKCKSDDVGQIITVDIPKRQKTTKENTIKGSNKLILG